MLLVAGLTMYLWFRGDRPREHTLRMTAGDPLTHRHTLAALLRDEASKHGLNIQLTGHGRLAGVADKSRGRRVRRRPWHWGISIFPTSTCAQVAVLNSEAMHLFVRPELVAGGLTGLRGRRSAWAAPARTRSKCRTACCNSSAWTAGTDYKEVDIHYAGAANVARRTNCPTAFLPSRRCRGWKWARLLVKKHGYRLMDLPFGDAVALRNPSVHDLVIPAYSYGIDPPVPDHPVAHRRSATAGRRQSRHVRRRGRAADERIVRE